ncbi:hypothetical protein Rsub_12533 [Raphidocelis subcapitata]|uniref:CDK5RAP3-like protein n=1 Tax=Raphidocelis subcapitata TaxID=307507 RepID=A0A2V0PIZ0_9CHLO|nr:hypothetical protein Rsub_12533 [Raphidocelis subcapitata]|eukprot:GBF99758.1 hypothetical protein Rsub_12533 [Raphidocelis subcapitata]
MAAPVARLMESGVGRAEGELPLDINYQKLAEWLGSRKRLPADWHRRLAAIQAKVAEAAKDLPPGLLAGLPGGADAPIDYFRAVALRDALAAGGERTLFGGLAGAAGVWDAIVKAYEKQNVFMGEAASTMVANVDYELPYLRKQAARYSQLIADAERRGSEYVKAAATCANNFKQESARLGIAGASVRAELAQLGASLPAAFEAILPQLRGEGLGAAIDYYRHFVAYAAAAASGEPQAAVDAAPEDLPDVLPTLAEVREGRTAPPPERSGGAAEAAAAAAPAVEIDWDAALTGGDDAAGAADPGAAADAIDWDLDLSDLVVAGGGEDTGAEPLAAEASGGGEGDAPAISWDIELTEAAAAEAEAAGGEAATAPSDLLQQRPAAGEVEAAAARLAGDADYRAGLSDDLQELRAFLTQRRAELSGGGGGADMLHALLPPAVAAVDARDVGRLLAAVEGALSALADPQLRQLLLIAGSARYLDRLSRELGRKAGQEAKMLAAAKEADARRHESRAALAALAPRSAALAERTRIAQRGVEAALSAQLGRRVHVLGEINSALAAAAKAAAA